MSTVKFRKVPELFPNRKVRTVRTEQLQARLRHAFLLRNVFNYMHVYRGS